jgi:3-oxoacyl-[acyl-carrier-protein] synthase III
VASDGGTENKERYYRLYRSGNWKEAKAFVLEACSVTVAKLLEASGLSMKDIDCFLITENNRRLWLAILERLGVEEHRTLSVLRQYGNTMSAMLPLLLDQAIRSGGILSGQRVLLLSIGEGISGGGLVYRV